MPSSITNMASFSLVTGFLLLTGFALCNCMPQPNTHYYHFVVKETNFTRLCMTKSMLTVNDSFPGPVIRVQKGDTAFVNVDNQGDYGLTIHWHGVKQPRNPWSDGPEYITQCTIEPGSNFTYEVIFSTEEGTLWWHAHSQWTRATVHGAIVVYPAAGTTYPFPEPDDEEIIVLASWYEEDVEASVNQGDIKDIRSKAYTINGQPGDLSACSNDTTYRRLVDYGKTYLLRVVNAGMNIELFFSVAQHNLTVVGMDGNYMKPISTSYIMISPGQTMDILMTANQSLGQYYMAARQYDNVALNISAFDMANATAIFEYKGNYTPPPSPYFPTDTLPSYWDFDAAIDFTRQFRSLASHDHPIDVPLNITTSMFITVSISDVDSQLATSLNNISWANPSTDVLLAYYRNLSGFYTTDFPDNPPFFFNFTQDELPMSVAEAAKGTKVKVVNYNESIEIVFQGTNVMNSSEDHAMHMHGYNFFVVGSGYGNYDNVSDPQGYNLIDPPQVNTVSVPKNGWVTIRFVANNPGVWFWHCHYDRHLSWGMNTAFIVRNGGTPETSIREPPAYMPPCNVPRLQEFDDSTGKINKSIF